MGKRIGRNPGSRRLASCIRRTSLPGEGRHNRFRQPSCHCRHEPCSTNQSGEPRRIRKGRIPRKKLIATQAGEGYFQPHFPRRPGNKIGVHAVHRGLVQCPKGLVNALHDCSAVQRHFGVLGSVAARNRPRGFAFIKCCAWEGQRKALNPRRRFSRQRRDGSRVEPARKEQAHRDIRDQMRPHGVFEHRTQLLGGGSEVARFPGVLRRRGSRGIPPRARARYATALGNVQQHAVARRQAEHSFDKRYRLAHAAKEQIRCQRVGRHVFGSRACGEQRPHFRCEGKSLGRLRVIERLNSQGIARQKQNRRRRVPLPQIEQGKRKHPTEFAECVFSPLFPCVDENFRVRLCSEAMPAQAQALAQVAVAVQLAVEHHGDIPGFIPDGLLASSQVDDAQPAHAKRQSGRTRFAHKESFFIRAAMPHRRGHRPHSRLRLRITRGEGDSADPAHAIL